MSPYCSTYGQPVHGRHGCGSQPHPAWRGEELSCSFGEAVSRVVCGLKVGQGDGCVHHRVFIKMSVLGPHWPP